ncbi:HLA class II histocompatibility antigen, DP beta 1 chain-like [Hoplias malabaricus]|uniref:HLA class II histocompatibility antigen, DP beta 1 chain-like n=1 Tax=Hoplias malabaricus TaxID=27720 RepID=UPI003461BAF0
MFLSLQLLLLLTLTIRTALTGGYYVYETNECLSSSSDLTDVEFIRTTYFNKDPVARFNSTVGEFVGYTEYGVKQAKYWNSGPQVQQMRSEVERVCKPNLEIDFSSVLMKAVKPRVELNAEQQPSGGHTSMLICSAYDFYPPVIDVYWQRGGKKVTTDVISTDELADGDWYYQVHSHLEYTPRSEEKISCVVEHASFSGPMVYDWDPSLPESERSKIAIGASGLVLGLILSAAGFIYYKKKSSGRILVPS